MAAKVDGVEFPDISRISVIKVEPPGETRGRGRPYPNGESGWPAEPQQEGMVLASHPKARRSC